MGFSHKKWQTNNVSNNVNNQRMNEFEADKTAGKETVRKYGSGDKDGNAPVKSL
jgi:hypothetical protein